MLEAGLALLVLLGRLTHHLLQLGTVKEVAGVLEDVLGTVVDGLPDEDLDQAQQLWVLPEVLLILNAQLELSG